VTVSDADPLPPAAENPATEELSEKLQFPACVTVSAVLPIGKRSERDPVAAVAPTDMLIVALPVPDAAEFSVAANG
jgi:hypothetical protein